jgi:O-antigen/teichoic acid export membrane protein
MSRASTILRNVASNWAGFAVNAVVTLFLTPFVLHALGTARYGVWILTSSIIGYYGLLDLGFRDGVTQYLTRYLAVRDYRRAKECMSTAVAVLGSVGALIVVLSVGAAWLAPHVLHLPDGMDREASWCILVVGLSSAFQFGLQPFTSVFTATQRFDLANAIGVSTRILTAAGIVTALKFGCGLIGVSVVTCGVSVVDYVIRFHVARRLAPELSVSWRYATRERLTEIGAFGAWNFLISVNNIVSQNVPSLLIGTMMPIAAVGHYALAMGLVRQINSILSPVPQVLYPAAAELYARDDRARLERLYHDGTRLVQVILFTIVLVSGFWATDFYRLWVGEKYLSGSPFHSVALLFRVLLLSIGLSYCTTMASYLLIASGRVKAVALALLCSSAINFTLALVLLPRFGLLGVAIGALAGALVVNVTALPILVQRMLGFRVAVWFANACSRPLAAAALQWMLIELVRTAGRPDSWVQLVARGVVATAGSMAIVLAIGVTAPERRRALSYVPGPWRDVDGMRVARQAPTA